MQLKYNPFQDMGITNYEQFSLYPFLVFGTFDKVKNRIDQRIKEINDGYFFGEKLLIVGERGIGKTSSLFYIKKLLKEGNIKVELFSRLIEDADHFYTITGERFSDATVNPLFILVDFPDTHESVKLKKFLSFLWDMMTHPNSKNINLVLTMNKSHYDKSLSYSEILGKFTNLRLEKLDKEETKELISARLEKVDEVLDNVFNEEVLDIIFSYSKGIPRNIMSACCLLLENSNVKVITKTLTENVLKEKYVDQVINDRVVDLGLKRIFKQMTKILEEEFKGTTNSQEAYVKKVQAGCNIGRNSAMARIKDLIRFGILVEYRGGYNNVNKIISFS